MQNFAPIALFVYNRPEHAARTLNFLRRNSLAQESRLFVFSDGYKAEQDKEEVEEVRTVIQSIEGFKSVTLIQHDKNYGLANNIINGVSMLVQRYGQVIVLEDDLITSPYTLEYFNEALARFRAEEKVMHIGAYMYPLQPTHLPETFFYRAASSWGWATWDRAWKHFNPDIDDLIAQFDARKRKDFSVDHTMNFWKQMLEFKKGKNNSWAIRWYASIFLKNGLTLNPAHSLVNNIGHDGSGIHSGINEIYNVVVNPRPIQNWPTTIKENPEAYQAIKTFLKHRKGSLWARIKRYLKQLPKRV